MKDRLILSLCGGSGAWEHPYRQAGYRVLNASLPEHDVRSFDPPEGVYGILAAPPCDQFSFALNEKIERDLERGLEIVRACQRIIEVCRQRGGLKFWALENPVGHLNRFLGRPRFIFQPWEFGDPWTKRTAIWGAFNSPAKTYSDWSAVPKIPELYIRPGRSKPNMVWLHKSAKALIPSFAPFDAPTDAAFRAITPQGFARAFFEANR